MRRYLGNESYAVETIGTADDKQDSDAREILSFHQAQTKVRELAKKYRLQVPGGATLTVKDAIEAYLRGQRTGPAFAANPARLGSRNLLKAAC
jgi:hypothetical protein